MHDATAPIFHRPASDAHVKRVRDYIDSLPPGSFSSRRRQRPDHHPSESAVHFGDTSLPEAPKRPHEPQLD